MTVATQTRHLLFQRAKKRTFTFHNLTYDKVLRSEIPSGMCAKLRTVAASSNRVHMPWSLYYCLFAPHICMVLFFRHILFVVNHTFNATPPERLQQKHGWNKKRNQKIRNALPSKTFDGVDQFARSRYKCCLDFSCRCITSDGLERGEWSRCPGPKPNIK